MSGSSGYGFGISGLANTALNLPEQLIFGLDDPVILGPIIFDGFEVPERINWGGSQKFTIHTLPGGERVVDVMGREEDAPAWSGTFLGLGAMDRAKQLDVLRAQGNQLQLTWGTLSYTVVIKSFQAEYKFVHQIPYKITCEVVRDNAAPVPDNSVPADQSVSNDVQSASNRVPSDAAPSGATKTTVETGNGTTATQTYLPEPPVPPPGGEPLPEPPIPPAGGAPVASVAPGGSNVPESSVTTLNAGSSYALPLDSSAPASLGAAQISADQQSLFFANAPLFTGQ